MPRLSKIGAAALAAFGWTGGLSSVTATYLVVAGGGGGGGLIDGGGGAGGFLTGTVTLSTAQSYTVTVGAGGLGAATYNGVGYQGGNSVFSGNTAIGGGGGGGATQTSLMNGGSGGGRGHGTTGSGGTGTVGQGNNGGGHVYTAPNYPSGGGGGAGAVGGTPASGSSGGGAGGVGLASSISGTSTYYAGGGGGGVYAGGSYGGGGTGGGSAANAGSATANTGGGAGGGSTTNNGGSGIVIISYSGAQKFSGGVVTSSGGNTIHTFNTSGTLGPITTLSASYLIVAGGGAGGGTTSAQQYSGGGGGAGGLLSGSGLTIDPNSTYLVTVGAGGAGTTAAPTAGTNSTFSMVATTAVAGGGGGYNGGNGSNGGSGGGGGGNVPTKTGGTGTAGQGYDGGTGGVTTNNVYGGGGGGGAGGIGGNATGSGAGNGGVGVASSISGTSTYYAGGGGGGAYAVAAGTGGNGGGGAGGLNANGTSGTANTGGGGGGCGENSTYSGGNGGSGVVIISYPGSTQQMAGGTVTITGGNVIHTFTSTGYLAPLKLVNNSLRFRSTASAYLNRTFATPTNVLKWTWSGWLKIGGIPSYNPIFAGGTSGSAYGAFWFNNGALVVYSYNGATVYQVQSSAVYRDPSAWYHIQVAFDSTQATAANRIILYVNGVQVTALSVATYPSQNYSGFVNSAIAHYIGQFTPAGVGYFDGYMAEVNFVDGQALTPSSFGTFNSYGVWQPITYGGSYGANGFYLPFNAKTSSYVGSFNGSNQYLSIASNAAFNQSGDFTIEYYANLTSNTNYQVVVGRGTGFITIQHSSDANNMIRLVRYGQATLATGGNVTAGKWNHFAIVRSGSTVNGYLNGVLVATATDSTSTATGNALAIGQNSDGTNYFTGQISNVRYTNTAVYTSNFTPPTSALTAVTGTQLLTLQNSSVVDNSTNAFSITNNNGVSTGQTYPFSYGIFNDQGPAGNNWTPNNVSGAFGTTLDYMTDVPTLTSATAANYAVLNPLAYGSTGTSTINNGNLSFSNPSAHASTTSTIGVTSGKYYLECTVTTSNPLGLGITTSTVPYSAYPGAVTGLWWVYDNTGTFQINNQTSTPYSGSSKVAINQIWQIALDMDNGKAWFGINNTWYDSTGGTTGNPSTGANATFSSLPTTSPMFFFIEVAGAVWAATFGQRPYNYTPPTNFVGLNTYNL